MASRSSKLQISTTGKKSTVSGGFGVGGNIICRAGSSAPLKSSCSTGYRILRSSSSFNRRSSRFCQSVPQKPRNASAAGSIANFVTRHVECANDMMPVWRGVGQGGIHRIQSTSKILIYYLLVYDSRRQNEFPARESQTGLSTDSLFENYATH